MNTQKAVYEKLFKKDTTELASQEVELAMFKSVQEIQKMYADINSISSDTLKYTKMMQDAVNGLSAISRSLSVRGDEFITEANRTITEAKALGLEAPKQILDLPKFAKGWKDKANAINKLNAQITASIKSI